ncbi:MAG: oligosaccharide flippase family protein [Planctomycetes bacterium]|nr:oligosaccharide flippase family protein [Planctomycetota bacterium]
MTLRHRTLASARWSVIRLLSVNALQLLQLGLLARLLEPEHFGAMAIVITVLTLAEAFTQTGLEMVIVRDREAGRGLLDAAWSVQVVRGALLALVVLLVAWPVCEFQESPRLFALLAAAALVPALDGARNVGPVLYARDLRQAPLVLAEIAVTVAGALFSIAAAWYLRSPWALAANVIFFTALKSAVSYWIHPFRPRFTLRWGVLRRAASFGFYANLALATGYLLVCADKFVVGKAYGENLLGIYDRAFLLSNIAALHLPRFLAATVFPSFSQLRAHPQRFRVHARRYLLLLAGGFAALSGLLFAAAPRIIDLVYGAKFAGAVPLFRILLFHGALFGIATGIHALFLVLGRPRLCFFANAAHLATFLCLLPGALAARDPSAVAYAMGAAALAGLAATAAFAWWGGIALGETPAAGAADAVTERAAEAPVAAPETVAS